MRWGLAVSRVMAAATLAMSIADHVRDDACKLECLEAIELHLLRPAAAEPQEAYGIAQDAFTQA